MAISHPGRGMTDAASDCAACSVTLGAPAAVSAPYLRAVRLAGVH